MTNCSVTHQTAWQEVEIMPKYRVIITKKSTKVQRRKWLFWVTEYECDLNMFHGNMKHYHGAIIELTRDYLGLCSPFGKGE
jgi:hypothetical protein